MKEVETLTHALLAILAVALVSSVGAGVALHAMDASSSNLITIQGKVVAVEWNPHWNATPEIRVNANNTNYSVSLGPPWWWAEHKYPLIKVNDTVKVTGVIDNEANETANETAEITAWTISINGGAVITLRTGGMPAWAQERSGQTPKAGSENDTEND